jgi:biopolymer transport protein ExbB
MLWLTVVEWLARLILIIMVGLSIWSVSIMIERRKYFKSLKLPKHDFKKAIDFKHQGETHFYSDLIKELSTMKEPQQMDKFFNAYATEKRKELDKGLPILATLGSTSPFIGLLGTILGIIVSFGELSRGTGSTNSVMFSLAEALILTAVGLVVAIPAVIAFNYYNRQVKMILADGESLKDLYIAYKE